MGVSTKSSSASMGDIGIQNIDLGSIDITTRTSNYQDYEEIDYSQAPIEEVEETGAEIEDDMVLVEGTVTPIDYVEPVHSTLTEKDIQNEIISMYQALCESISELRPQVEALESQYNTAMINVRNPIPFMQSFNSNNLSSELSE